MPGALPPDDPATPAPQDWYSADELGVYDDDGRRRGLRRREHFVIAGAQNADPFDGDEWTTRSGSCSTARVGTFSFALLPDGNGFPSSDHRLVAVDVNVPSGRDKRR